MNNISDVELRISQHIWQNLPEHIRAHIKELAEDFAYDYGYDFEFEYLWLKLHPEEYFLLEMASPGFMPYFRRAL